MKCGLIAKEVNSKQCLAHTWALHQAPLKLSMECFKVINLCANVFIRTVLLLFLDFKKSATELTTKNICNF